MDAGTPRQPLMMSPEKDSAVNKSEEEDAVVKAFGIKNKNYRSPNKQEEPEEGYDMVPNPDADVVDLSDLRGTRAPGTMDRHGK